MILHKKWRDYTAPEIRQLKIENCIPCFYSGCNSMDENARIQQINNLSCDYILKTLKKRPCRPEECREKGVWKPK